MISKKPQTVARKKHSVLRDDPYTVKTVNKLGGGCLQSLEDFQRLPALFADHPGIIVVSAAFGVTQKLLLSLHLAETGKTYERKIRELIAYHRTLCQALTDDKAFLEDLKKDEQDILALLRGVSLLGIYSKQQHDWLLGYGEYWNSRLIAAYLQLPWLDAGQIIVVSHSNAMVNVDWKKSTKNWRKALKNLPFESLVVPGFVAEDEQGQRTLLGFNGSDYTAAIIAKLVKACDLIKWTNIDGIYSADPKWVKTAFVIKQLCYEEAAELAYFGATVLHPQAVHPAIEAQTNIHIRNFFKPDKAGTLVNQQITDSELVVKGLSSIADVALINLQGAGFLGVSGMAGRIFAALSRVNVSVILFCQASSEYSVTLAIKQEQVEQAKTTIAKEFFFELGHGAMDRIETVVDCAVVAAVGEGMCGQLGVAARFFSTLAKAKTNVLAIAQASSERNISAVIAGSDIQKALRALHGGFYLSPKSVSIGLIGPGSVGGKLLDQIRENSQRLKAQFNVDFHVRGIMNSQKMFLKESRIDLKKWPVLLNDKGEKSNISLFLQHITSPEIPHAMIIDTTSAEPVARAYADIFASGCHLVTPNKKANSSPWPLYQKMWHNIKTNQCHYLYEATVCAGLPIINTIKDLMATGDVIKRIEGIVSGTLSFVFYSCAKGMSFADAVLKAHELGYTEPDPREDLNGLDVARKFVCLARELGYQVELEDVALLNLVPEGLKSVSQDQFLKELPNHQQAIEKQIKTLLKGQAALAYVGIIEEGKISIQLNAYPASHPFANISGTDNILMIQSHRYDKQPLIIQGPGAGADVTAAGVFADILHLVSML